MILVLTIRIQLIRGKIGFNIDHRFNVILKPKSGSFYHLGINLPHYFCKLEGFSCYVNVLTDLFKNSDGFLVFVVRNVLEPYQRYFEFGVSY